MIKKIALFFFFISPAFSEEMPNSVSQPSGRSIKTPEEISAEIDSVQYDFQVAQDMFIPWYTGPLITGSANNVPFGRINIQPYLYFTVDHAVYDGHRHSKNISNVYVINPLFVFQAGLTNWLDVTVVPQGYFSWQSGHSGQAFGDFPLEFGLQLYKETPYVPSFRMIVGQLFPTGSYQKLNPNKNGLDAAGQGVYATILGLNISKVFWGIKLHPVALRLSTQYTQPQGKAHVEGFNSYGGGYGTRGKVSVGASFSADLGAEVSISQKWVFATDIAYTCSTSSPFRGNPGVDQFGNAAQVGSPSSDQLSIAPAIEYNVTNTGGFIGGVWFSVTGRNSSNFASLVLSYTQLF
ncbi:MAG: hypothetical protein EBZ47_02245 [Chlamydiae bacterium]|nr:hypothetical protein [Chlamydiota bacterium]